MMAPPELYGIWDCSAGGRWLISLGEDLPGDVETLLCFTDRADAELAAAALMDQHERLIGGTLFYVVESLIPARPLARVTFRGSN